MKSRVAVVALALTIGGCAVMKMLPPLVHLAGEGDVRELRDREPAPVPAGKTSLLILAIDGAGRAPLYELLRAGELPGVEALIGGLDHAYLDDTAQAPMPTLTFPSWATIFTGADPAEHGVVGNEYFLRGERRLVALLGTSVGAPDLTLKVYSDGHAGDQLDALTLYERLHAEDPDAIAWVAMHPFFRGADRLILPARSELDAVLRAKLDGKRGDDVIELSSAVDRAIVAGVIDELRENPAPRLLTVYLPGLDYVAHLSDEGPERSRRRYLREVVDPLARELAAALDDRAVIIVSDHGQIEVPYDGEHAIGTDDEDPRDPAAILARAGYRLRPFEVDVDDDADFDVVLAYGDAIAYVHVADRSTCRRGAPCAWSHPPRFDEDVVPLAETLRDGLGDAVDMVLVRRPGAPAPAPFVEYLGDGRTRPLAGALDRRLRKLATGRHGGRAGDVMLIAGNGHYFDAPIHATHGGPSAVESEIALVVADPRRTRGELRAAVRRLTGKRTDATEIITIAEHLLTRSR